MKRMSVKSKLTVWLTALIGVMSVALLIFAVGISASVVSSTAMDRLAETVMGDVEKVSFSGGKLSFADDFTFYRNGVSILIYSSSGTLLAGQPPVAFKDAGADFENGVTRMVEQDGGGYYVMDLWRPEGWESGVWIRGMTEVPEQSDTIENVLILASVALPLFIAIAGVGIYLIAKRSFRPLTGIMAAADAINEARDLKGRIGLPPGKDEFSRLAATFDRMFERLERAFENEKRFTADASHELRTPVSVIKGACEYSEKFDETEEELRESMAMIHRQATRMAELISQLLSITRMDQGTERSNFENGDLSEFVEGVVCAQCRDGSRLELDLEKGVFASYDRALMERLVVNLVDNAFKYGKEDGTVRVSVKRTGGVCALSVADEGDGIPEEIRDKIWQRFYQADPSRSGGSGAGLGLSMVKQIAHAHGGEMTLFSEQGRGSTFTLTMPCAKGGEQLQ